LTDYLLSAFHLSSPEDYLLGNTKSGTSLKGLTRLNPNSIGGLGALKYWFL
jgi:hypothetical protein